MYESFSLLLSVMTLLLSLCETLRRSISLSASLSCWQGIVPTVREGLAWVIENKFERSGFCAELLLFVKQTNPNIYK